jgi:hypothetical protein
MANPMVKRAEEARVGFLTLVSNGILKILETEEDV